MCLMAVSGLHLRVNQSPQVLSKATGCYRSSKQLQPDAGAQQRSPQDSFQKLAWSKYGAKNVLLPSRRTPASLQPENKKAIPF